MSAMDDDAPYCLIVQPQADDPEYYEVRWVSYDPGRDDGRFSGGLAPIFIDLAPFMVARELLDRYYDPSRLLIIKLYGSDRELVHAPLGAVAATPIVNLQAPVNRRTHMIYRRRIEE